MNPQRRRIQRTGGPDGHIELSQGREFGDSDLPWPQTRVGLYRYADYPSNWEGTRTSSSLVIMQSSPSLPLKRTFILSSKRVFNSCLSPANLGAGSNTSRRTSLPYEAFVSMPEVGSNPSAKTPLSIQTLEVAPGMVSDCHVPAHPR